MKLFGINLHEQRDLLDSLAVNSSMLIKFREPVSKSKDGIGFFVSLSWSKDKKQSEPKSLIDHHKVFRATVTEISPSRRNVALSINNEVNWFPVNAFRIMEVLN